MRTSIVLGLLLLAVAAAGHAADPDPSLPHLRRQGTATQLMVGGKPFLMRGGELGNSTATNAAPPDRSRRCPRRPPLPS